MDRLASQVEGVIPCLLIRQLQQAVPLRPLSSGSYKGYIGNSVGAPARRACASLERKGAPNR